MKLKHFCLGFRHRLKEIYMSVKDLSWSYSWKDVAADERESGIAMIDGKVYHGGICDRFKGLISFYAYCKYVGKPFRIRYNFPFELTDFLVPNKYDWRISDQNISDSIWHVRIISTRAEKGKRLLKLRTKKQIRFYGNYDLTKFIHFPPFNEDWGSVFNYLFKPSPALQEHLDFHKKEINGRYVAAVYRFQNLLGDFEEYHYKAIASEEYKEKMVTANLKELENIHKEYPEVKILVTSDSNAFLERASELDYVYAIKGKQSHVDTKNAPQSNSIKPFIDFYMIAGAEKVFGIIINDMYKSEFPIYAAKIGNVPYIRIEKRLDMTK